MSVLKTVGVELIDANPFRCLSEYPWIENKIEALQRSIADVGLWEGLIVRKSGTRLQMAFGHHRLEAARRSGLTAISVIQRELTDEQMLQFMGRENGEDYTTDFLTMLNTWEGAIDFLTPPKLSAKAEQKIENTLDQLQRHQIIRDEANEIIVAIDPDWHRRLVAGNRSPIDIARLLGWTRKADGPHDRMNDVAAGCANAYTLIVNDFITRSDLTGLSVKQAREIVGRAITRMKQLDKLAQTTKRPKKEVERVKKQVAKGAKITAKSAQKGHVLTKDLRATVDAETHKVAARSKIKESPLFAVFGKTLSDNLERMLDSDSAASKLKNVVDALNNITLDDDAAMVRRLNFDLGELSKRASTWQKKLVLDKVQQVRFPMLEGGKK